MKYGVNILMMGCLSILGWSSFTLFAAVNDNVSKVNESSTASEKRIITLAPHLTELVFLLNEESHLVAVSDYSDYPVAASQLPSVASYTGLDFNAIIKARPTHILAWEGGNKPQDIAKLISLGFNVLSQRTTTLNEISQNITALGEFLDSPMAAIVSGQFDSMLEQLQQTYSDRQPQTVFYYSWSMPLMSIGAGAWGNEALKVCQLTHIFADVPIEYPQVALAEVLRAQPDYIINVSKEAIDSVNGFWSPHNAVLDAPLIQLNPDLIHRYTPRILPEIARLCAATAP